MMATRVSRWQRIDALSVRYDIFKLLFMKIGRSFFKIFFFIAQNGRSIFVYFFGPKGEHLIKNFFYQFYILNYEFRQKIKKQKVNDDDREAVFLYEKKEAAPGENVTIVIPVFNAYEDLKDCLNSVVLKTGHPYRLLIIDDGSTDPRITDLIESYSNAYPNIRAVYNDKNLGYTATINKGCRLAGSDDVVLLNSDTRVTDNWLAKLNACAKSENNIATVTPLSNAAGVFSVPEKNITNELRDWISIDEMGKLVEEQSFKLRPRVPTGNGFCMYVTRLALEVVGEFDEKNFPRGYGEENDFCMRAGQKGFIHLIEDSTYIYHKRSASFNKTKKKLMSGSMHKLYLIHPEYRYLVMKWLVADPLDGFRELLRDKVNTYRIDAKTGRR